MVDCICDQLKVSIYFYFWAHTRVYFSFFLLLRYEMIDFENSTPYANHSCSPYPLESYQIKIHVLKIVIWPKEAATNICTHQSQSFSIWFDLIWFDFCFILHLRCWTEKMRYSFKRDGHTNIHELQNKIKKCKQKWKRNRRRKAMVYKSVWLKEKEK